ncbi:MAG: NADH-quinone oxidoreductase subunit J [Anaerolineae bacterium]|nr:NADH-quinone oxidoreductase subunit J [Ardenticatenia bacterium]MBK8540974.1 NADH-quinone oxidoreductase subunit J [Ardenticatenia bacterium]HQZ69935.1 NADH-quinone oxidoreductase subunit J [Anaerolineae bacterium]HRA20722.1 NADH-quinone oxidoreductase subunit J [Anaerolineae bacterium]
MSQQTVVQLVFGVMAALSLGGAMGVVMARTVFVSALWLILSFVGVAGLYITLGAGFLAVIQVLVYVGAISVLILFAIMLTEDVMGDEHPNNGQVGLAIILLTPLIFLLGKWGFTANWPVKAAAILPRSGLSVDAATAAALPGALKTGDAFLVPDSVAYLGRVLMTEHFLAFEVVSVVLLVALVGAIVIARD